MRVHAQHGSLNSIEAWVEAGGLTLKVYANREGAANIDIEEGEETTRIAVSDLAELVAALTDLERQRQELLGAT